MQNPLTTARSIIRLIADIIAPPIPIAYHDWHPTQEKMTLLPPPEIQTTGGLLPVAGGKRWHGPVGTFSAIVRGNSPYRRREGEPSRWEQDRHTSPMQKLRPRQFVPVEDDWESQVAAIARLKCEPDMAWLFVDPPGLLPLPEQSLSAEDRTAMSTILEVTEEDCTPNLLMDNDLTEQRAAVNERRAIEHIIEQMKTKKES